MIPNTAIYSIDECFTYLSLLSSILASPGPNDPVRVNFRMLRSLYFHVGCAKFGVPVSDDLELLDVQIKQLCRELARGETRK